MSAVDDTTTLEMDDFLGIVANGLVAKKKPNIHCMNDWDRLYSFLVSSQINLYLLRQ